MQTTEPLMMEHQVIAQLLKQIHTELDKIEETGKPDPLFVEVAVDFIHTYVDRTPHEKDKGMRTMSD
jgi:hemerythrin-like domain-containing protein